MIRTVTYLLMAFGILMSCGKKECDFSGRHRFQLPVELSPVKDTFQIGDTILVSSFFDSEVFETKTSRTYRLEDFDFYPTVAINKLDTSTVDHNASRFFELHADEGVDIAPYLFNSGSHRFLGEYSYSNEHYHLEFFLIPRKPGFYLFDITSFLYPQDEDQNFTGKCGNTPSEAFMKLNEGEEETNNHHLLTNSGDPVFVNEVLEEGELDGSFLFYVVE